MACILKIKTETSPGIISFTTQEEILIRYNKRNLNLFKKLKNSYITCLHYNWHNFDYYPDKLFDIHFAGKDDLIIKNNEKINIFNLDACNFCPSFFEYNEKEKHWDILYIARSVFFKGIPNFFNSIRTLYDKGRMYRVLFLCPVPPEKNREYKKLRTLFEKLFSLEERSFFNFLPLFEDYPFFFDLETLAHFYKFSKIFVHTAPSERRCRVAAYAFACGLPVVGRKNVGSILNKDLQVQPIFYEVNNNDFTSQIELALRDYCPKNKNDESINLFNNEISKNRLKTMFKEYFEESGLKLEGTWFCEKLNLRLGSHFGFGNGPNLYGKSIEGLLLDLMNEGIMNRLKKSIVENELIYISNKGLGKTDKINFSYMLKNQLRRYYDILVSLIKNIIKIKSKSNFK